MKMKNLKIIVAFALMALALGSNVTAVASELQTVSYVNVEKYLGSWYEIAKIPTFFQKKCLASKAEYSLGKKGKIQVKNSCNLVKEPTRIDTAKGRARITDKSTNAKLRVSFSPILPKLFEGDYWIIKLEEGPTQYELAVVGHPKLTYLWILSRTPEISETKYQELMAFLTSVGYDTTKIVKSPTWPTL